MKRYPFLIPCLMMLFAGIGLGLLNYKIWQTQADGWSPESRRDVPRQTKQDAFIQHQTANNESNEESHRGEDHSVIYMKNIFHPERTEFPAAQGREVKPESKTRPQITLYGIALSEKFGSATIANSSGPNRKSGGEPKSVQVGDLVGDYRLAKIQEDRIFMEGDGDAFEVLLYDPNAPKKRMAATMNVQPAAITKVVGSGEKIVKSEIRGGSSSSAQKITPEGSHSPAAKLQENPSMVLGQQRRDPSLPASSLQIPKAAESTANTAAVGGQQTNDQSGGEIQNPTPLPQIADLQPGWRKWGIYNIYIPERR